MVDLALGARVRIKRVKELLKLVDHQSIHKSSALVKANPTFRADKSHNKECVTTDFPVITHQLGIPLSATRAS